MRAADRKRARALLRQAAGVRGAIDRFAGLVAEVCPIVTSTVIARIDTQGSAYLQALLPERGPQFHSLEPGTPWDAALFYGETIRCAGEDVHAALAPLHVETSDPGLPEPPAALTIVPLVTAGRVVGAVGLGEPTTATHNALDLARVRELGRALAPYLLDYPLDIVRDATQHKRRQVLSRLLHDLRTPLSGIGLAAELMELDPPSVPSVIMDAMRVHYADLLRYMIELENLVFVDFVPGFPAAQQLTLSNVLEAVLWRVKPYTRRRGQEMNIYGVADRPLLMSQHHLEQALTATLFDVSACCSEHSPLQISMETVVDRAMIAIGGSTDRPTVDIRETLINPYLRAEPRQHGAELMSLAGAKRALEHYGGDLSVAAGSTSLSIVLTMPVA